jgi:hypothetical protein
MIIGVELDMETLSLDRVKTDLSLVGFLKCDVGWLQDKDTFQIRLVREGSMYISSNLK